MWRGAIVPGPVQKLPRAGGRPFPDALLGIGGAPPLLAWVELDILRLTNLGGVLYVEAIGALPGEMADRAETIGHFLTTAPGSATRTQFRMVADAGITLELLAEGGGASVAVWAPFSSNEVHCRGEALVADGYALFAISDSADNVLPDRLGLPFRPIVSRLGFDRVRNRPVRA